MKPASHNMLMTVAFFIVVVVIASCNKVCLTVQAKEITTMGLVHGAQVPLIFMFIFGIMTCVEDDK